MWRLPFMGSQSRERLLPAKGCANAPRADGAAFSAAPDGGSVQRRNGTKDVNDPGPGTRRCPARAQRVVHVLGSVCPSLVLVTGGCVNTSRDVARCVSGHAGARVLNTQNKWRDRVLARVQGAAKTACWTVTGALCRRLDDASLPARLAPSRGKVTNCGCDLVSRFYVRVGRSDAETPVSGCRSELPDRELRTPRDRLFPERFCRVRTCSMKPVRTAGSSRHCWRGSHPAGGCFIHADPTLRPLILRGRWRASRLPSRGSALRGLDPRHALLLRGTCQSVGGV